jgi:hypothetical protein
MNVVGLVLGWLLEILFGLLTLSMALMRNWLQAIPLLAAMLIVLPPVSALIEQQTGVTPPLVAVGLLVAVRWRPLPCSVPSTNRRPSTAIDLVGDAGRSEYGSLDNRMRDGQDEAELHAEIMDQLGVVQACKGVSPSRCPRPGG